MTKEELEALPKVYLQYQYRDIGTGGKIIFVWKDTDTGKERNYSAVKGKNIANALIGETYSFPVSIEGQIWLVPSFAAGRQQVPEETLREWTMRDTIAVNLAKSKRQRKRLAADNSFRESLQPLRRYYNNLPFQERTAFIATLLYEVTKP